MFRQLDRTNCEDLQLLGLFADLENQCHSSFGWVLPCCLLFSLRYLQCPFLFYWYLLELLLLLFSAYLCPHPVLVHPWLMRIVCWDFLCWKWHRFCFKKYHLIFLKFNLFDRKAISILVKLFQVLLSSWWRFIFEMSDCHWCLPFLWAIYLLLFDSLLKAKYEIQLSLHDIPFSFRLFLWDCWEILI